MKKFLVLSFLFLFSSCFAISFSGNGSGSYTDPYQITNVEQLQEMNDDLYAVYILMNDIDASETKNWNIGDHDKNPETPDSAMGFKPIGNYKQEKPLVAFTGNLGGREYTISNLYINRPNKDGVGLFGCISDGAYIHDLSLEDANVTGHKFVGIIVGSTYAYSEESEIHIENCRSSGIAKGESCIGGFCGSNFSVYGKTEIVNCYSMANVVGEDEYSYIIGGFCGDNFSSYGTAIINNCHCFGEVTGNGYHYVGGFCGINLSSLGFSIISNCYSTGNVTSIGEKIGGFCGQNEVTDDGEAIISNCFSTGNITSYGDFLGGFCGSNYTTIGNVSISNCYSTGNVILIGEFSLATGGFCGYIGIEDETAFASIEKCYSIGKVIGSDNYMGFCGNHWIDGSINSCYWDIETSETSESVGGEGKTTPEMMMHTTFIDWDFEEIWCMVENETYPHLQAIEDCNNLISVDDSPTAKKINNIVLYPNPVSQRLNISADNIFGNEIRIFNLLGMKVWHSKAISDKIEIDVSTLPSGVYFLKIDRETRMFVKE